MNNVNKSDPKARRWARRFALQAVYQWQLSHNELSFIEAQFLKDDNIQRVDFPYFKDIFYGIAKNIEEINAIIAPHLDRPIEQIDPVELAIMRVAVYELLKRPDVPYRVAINEALELAKSFGATEGHKFVNGILDKVAKEIRAVEYK